MPGFNDFRCKKCKRPLSWFGEVTEPPPCRHCGHQNDYSEAARALDEIRAEMLAELKNESPEP